MLLRKYKIGDSSIPGAGRGLFVTEFVACGDIVVAPTHPDDVSSRHYIELFSSTGKDEPEPEVRDVRLINHSFAPTGHWHLGFIFACQDIPPGVEITVDYRLLGNVGCMPFLDGNTGREVSAFSEENALRTSLQRLRAITGVAPLRPTLDS